MEERITVFLWTVPEIFTDELKNEIAVSWVHCPYRFGRYKDKGCQTSYLINTSLFDSPPNNFGRMKFYGDNFSVSSGSYSYVCTTVHKDQNCADSEEKSMTSKSGAAQYRVI